MTLDQMRVIKAVVEHGSILAATKILHKSQPAISNMINRLEAELGIPLFDRDSYRLKLTPEGEHSQRALLLKLTPMEMRVCQFIQAGASTKDIAEALNLATVTIQTHRRNIRRKLDLQNRNVNLYTFLNQAN